MTTNSPSVLDQMTAGIMGPKATKAAKLTPIKGEESTTVAAMAGLTIPADVPGVLMAREGMADVAKDLRTQAGFLLAVADGLDVILGVPDAVERDAEKKAATDKALAEKEADRKAADRKAAEAGDKRAEKRMTEQEEFEAGLAAKAEAAQAATFTALDDDGTVEPAAPVWTCPTHGEANIHNLVARKSGRKYRACGSCDQYEPPPAK